MLANLKRRHFVLAGAAFVLLFMSLFQVTQGTSALLLRFGKLELDSQGNPKVFAPGLHLMYPLINTVQAFDMRLQTMSSDARENAARILTEEQKYVLVDYFVKWRIEDLALYYQRTGGQPRRAEVLLRQSIDDALRAAFGERKISEVVSGQRSDIMDLTRKSVEKNARYLGIHVVDVRIKRIDLPKAVSDSVFARMRADREKIATKHRSDGKKEAEKVRAKADADVTVLLASARAESERIKASGQSKAARIYNSAYSRDTRFYEFLRSMQAYQQTFNDQNDIIVLQPDSEFFKYFKSAS